MSGAPACSAIAADTNQNVYCRTSGGSLLRWSAPYATSETLYTDLPPGTDLAIDGTSTAYFTSTSPSYEVNSLSIAGADGGAALPTPVTSSRTFAPSGLEATSSYLWWLESGSLYATSTFGSTVYSTGAVSIVPARMAPDPLSTSYFWAASTTTIYRAYYAGGGSTTSFRSGLSGVGGVAADSTYVYWTQNDGQVHRASRY
jgi:hypothetical protein